MQSYNRSLQSMTVWNKVFTDPANNQLHVPSNSNLRLKNGDENFENTLDRPRCRPLTSVQYSENPSLSAMSISPCPSASTSKTLYQDQLQYQSRPSAPLILANGSTVYVNNERTPVDVVSKANSIRIPASSPLSVPSNHGDFINGHARNHQLRRVVRNLQDCPGFGSNSYVSTYQSPVSLPSSPTRFTGATSNANTNDRKVAFKRPRKFATKRPPNSCKGEFVSIGKSKENSLMLNMGQYSGFYSGGEW